MSSFTHPALRTRCPPPAPRGSSAPAACGHPPPPAAQGSPGHPALTPPAPPGPRGYLRGPSPAAREGGRLPRGRGGAGGRQSHGDRGGQCHGASGGQRKEQGLAGSGEGAGRLRLQPGHSGCAQSGQRGRGLEGSPGRWALGPPLRQAAAGSALLQRYRSTIKTSRRNTKARGNS